MYNEIDFIGECLNGFLSQDYPENIFNIIVIDGLSTDGSKEEVIRFQQKNSNIILLENKKRFTPISFNIGIRHSDSDVVGIFSAHSIPSNTYISTAIDVLISTNADCVGGPMTAISNSIVGKAISYTTSTPLGVGNSIFHYSKKPGYVNTVYQGFFYKNIFSQIGYFDEDLVRNQDDELSYRILKFGGSIYYEPKIKSVYHSRSNIKKLFVQYFQYGLYKPLVFIKTKHGMQIHHFVPALFVFYLFGFLIFFKSFYYFFPILLYLMLCIYFATNSKLNLKSKLLCLIIYPIIHASYGLGFILGFFKIFKKK
tara:strand:+ start:129 stop:1061 length:933 start_codon:yes stop_codon:yes gene_type:complete